MKKEVDNYLHSLLVYLDTRTSKGFGRKGIPDRTGCYRGLYFGIEIKELDTMKPTPWQEREMRKIVQAGGFAICVGAPTHLAQLAAFFAELDKHVRSPTDVHAYGGWPRN